MIEIRQNCWKLFLSQFHNESKWTFKQQLIQAHGRSLVVACVGNRQLYEQKTIRPRSTS